jgi:hypothetical protein
MPSSKSVQTTRIREQIRALHEALIDIISVINRPQRDEMMVREAGISLDRALFPLLVVIERRGPIGVVDLADRVNVKESALRCPWSVIGEQGSGSASPSRVTGHDKEDRPGMWPEWSPLGALRALRYSEELTQKWTPVPFRNNASQNIK